MKQICSLIFTYIHIDDDTSLIELQIDPSITDSNDARLRAQLQIQNIQMINVSRNKEDDFECEVEMIPGEISKIRVCKIPGDGNCLFGATVHQHFHLKVGSEEYKQQIVELRKEVVAHI